MSYTLSIGPDFTAIQVERIECNEAIPGDLLSPVGSLGVYRINRVDTYSGWQSFHCTKVGSENAATLGRETSITSSALIRAFRLIPSGTIVKRLGAYGTFTELQMSNRVRLFQAFLEIAGETVKHYLGDFYHDVHWIDENFHGPVTFYWSFDESGTYISAGPELGTYRKHAYRVDVTCNDKFPHHHAPGVVSGEWVATFTEVPSTGK